MGKFREFLKEEEKIFVIIKDIIGLDPQENNAFPLKQGTKVTNLRPFASELAVIIPGGKIIMIDKRDRSNLKEI